VAQPCGGKGETESGKAFRGESIFLQRYNFKVEML
jgi:hypothetical protein